ncbi:STM4015 family protein [Streptosporangium sp. NBC_01755]|uniref:STM4015 family protein n=1 Tax=Streptosporangium sp. NBC_01755 TaxID=2975949 RepID=UPI002DD868A8|nr:STM4015 family protein [Streptosporangium sp. NBC_01755]WSD00499.1 STM4015 family protein [Streptosporangium sp. NBC_01755]
MDHSEFNDDVDGLYRGEYAGLPIVSLRPPGAPMPAAGEAAWRLSVRVYDAKETFEEHFARFVATVDTTEVKAIIVGGWGEAYENDASGPIRLLAENAARLPALRSLFLGAMPSEECEISWIQQGDVTPLLEAFPLLERLEVRGGTGLELRPIRHDSLRILRFETGGLPPAVARAVGESDFPALEYLELWLGSENYGGDTTVADLEPILSGERLPALRHLGLQNSEIQDEVAAAVASAPVVARLESLAQSMGTLTDMGAEALLSGRSLTHLRRLDLHHHFLSDAMVERLRTTFSGVELDVSEQEKPDDDWYYVAVSE